MVVTVLLCLSFNIKYDDNEASTMTNSNTLFYSPLLLSFSPALTRSPFPRIYYSWKRSSNTFLLHYTNYRFFLMLSTCLERDKHFLKQRIRKKNYYDILILCVVCFYYLFIYSFLLFFLVIKPYLLICLEMMMIIIVISCNSLVRIIYFLRPPSPQPPHLS